MGSPNALIERPDHVVKWSLLKVLGVDPLLVDAASFASAGASLASAVPGGYKLGGIIARKTSFLNLWREWTDASRTRFFWDAEGKARLLFMPLNNSTAVSGQEVKTITQQMVLDDGFKIRRSP